MTQTQQADDEALDQWTLAELLQRTAADPTPGGGSVAAISAALGMGLVVMGLEITAKRPEMIDYSEQLRSLASEAREKMSALERHATADIAAFQQYMQAIRHPKQTPEQKAARKASLRAAMIEATEVPLAAAQDMYSALALTESACSVTHLHVISDVGAGAALLGGAITAILMNVDINLRSIADLATRERYAHRREEIAGDAQATTLRIVEQVRARIASGS